MADLELTSSSSSEEEVAAGSSWKRAALVALAGAAGLAAVGTWAAGRSVAAPAVAAPAAVAQSFSLPPGALPEGVVGLSPDLANISGTLSTGVDLEALSVEGYASELHGCCPMLGGKYLECCKLSGQCCPSPEGMFLSCCPQYKPPEPLMKCSGALGNNVCAPNSECCNGLCCGEGATCCGQICCGKGSTCCKDKFGVHICGAEGNVCGGDTGGAPLHWSNWPNPATPKSWSPDSKDFGETVFRVPPKPDGLVQCHGENGKMVCLDSAVCCNGLCCGADSQCCGNICCGKDATCCRNKYGHHYCGAPGNVCAGGVPLSSSDWPNPATPKNWEDPNQFGVTIFRKPQPAEPAGGQAAHVQ